MTRYTSSLSSFGLCLDLINTIARQRECIASRIIKGAGGASLGDRSSVASETGRHQSDRIVLVDGAARQRKTPARRISRCAGPYRTSGGIKRNQEIRLLRELLNPPRVQGERGPERRAHLNSLEGRSRLPNVGRCNQRKLRMPAAKPLVTLLDTTSPKRK